MNTNATSADEIIRIPCVGKTNFDRMVLILYQDHMVLMRNSGEVIFNEHYQNVSCMKKSENKLLPNAMILVLKNGTEHKFSLDRLHTLKGRYTKYYNPAIKQLSQTLPVFINKRAAQKKASFFCSNCGTRTINVKWCPGCETVSGSGNIQAAFCALCGGKLLDFMFCPNCKIVLK